MADAVPAKIDLSDQGRPAEEAPETRVRRMSLLWIAATLIFTCMAATFLEFKSRSAHMAMSNLPLAVLLLFIFWLLGNTLLKRVFPRFSLTTAELRTMLCVLWVGASFAGYNWVTQWVGALVSPRYFASPENRWKELIFDYLPWWMYPSNFPGVVEAFYLGLGRDEALPWGAWVGPIFWAGSAALAMTAIGLGLTAIFQKQWAEHERLTFPLAEVSLELTEGFDRRPGWAPFVCNRLFWVGFAIAAFPILWNLVEYWVPDFPRLTIFDPRNRGRTAPISRYLPWPFSYRLLPTLMGFTFLCDLNILFSLWSLKVVGQAVFYVMNRVGFSIGRTGQEADPMQIAGIFEHGVMLGLAVWAVWAARPHLKQVVRQVLRPVDGQTSVTAIFSARGSAVVLLGGVAYMVFWLHAAGYSLPMAAVWLGLFWASIFVAMKYLAASGFAYLWPHWSEPIPEMWVGTGRMSESTQVASRLIGWRVLSGWRLPPALPHVVRLIARPTRWLVPGSVVVGLLSAALYTIWLCYEEGGGAFRTWSLVGAPRGLYNTIASRIAETHPTVSDPAKIAVWIVGGLAATVVTALQAQFPWWPIHPLGLMLMFSWYVNLYLLDIFLVWLIKLLVLKLGGIGLYRRVKPVAYGLIVGYVFAVGCAFLVDLIWFPGGGHYIHGY
ncbi:MAG: hypothetical protein O7G87_02260 [bacterium]|nr:hypothetical protein [bacterium]